MPMRIFSRNSVTAVVILVAMIILASCGHDDTVITRPLTKANAAPAPRKVLPRQQLTLRPATGTPSAPPTLAPFLGNLTVVEASPNNGVILERQADCSLLYSNFMFDFSTTVFTATVQTQVPGYEKVLHNNAFLSTTPDLFAGGCTDQIIGHTSRIGENLGTGKAGARLTAALADNAVYAGAQDTAGNFHGPNELATDLPATSMSAGDFNNDGNQDVVSINTTGTESSMDIFLGNGDGTFGAAKVTSLGSQQVQFCVVDDMNKDGKLDVVVGASNGATFQFLVFLGNGDGTFAAPVSYTPGSASLSFFSTFITADVNGDGFRDIITSNGQVFLGQESGTAFTPAAASLPGINTATNLYAPGMVAIDLNQDGKVDLATDDGETIRIYYGNGDGTFSTGPAYASIFNRGFVVASDLDGDGNVDLFSGFGNSGAYGGDDFLPGTSYALLNNGDGTFAGAPKLPVQYAQTNLADLNGDGRPDLVDFTLNATNQSVLNTYLTQANGIPKLDQQLVLPAGSQAESPVLGKFVGATNFDAFWVGVTPIGPTLNLSVGNGDGSFGLPTTIPAPSLVPSGQDIQEDLQGVHTVDINHDGMADLVYWFFDIDGLTNTYYEGIAVQLGNGDGTFQAPKITYTYNSTTPIFDQQVSPFAGIFDVNKDNFPDVFLVAPGAIVDGTQQNSLEEFLSNGDGTFQAPTTIAATGNILPESSGYGPPVAFADLNGDGKVDLVVGGSSSDGTTPMIAIALGNGNGTFKTPMLLTIEGFGYPGGPVLADIDGDGKLDLAIAGSTQGGGGFFPGNGDGTFQSITNADGTVSPAELVELSLSGSPVAADFNKDGKMDLMFGGIILLNKTGATPPNMAATSTSVGAAPNPAAAGATVTLTATVTSTTAGTITGTVTFLDGGTSIGTGAVGAGGVATLMTSTLAAGSHSITASYGGDANYAGSVTATAVTLVINAAGKASTTTAVTSSLNPSTAGASVTFTAMVTSATPGTITGTVTFFDGGTQLGSGTLAAGAAAFMTTSLAAGSHSITASYGGDTNYATSTSGALTQTVNAATGDFSVSASPNSAMVTAGNAGIFGLTVTPSGGSTQTVMFSCTGLPAGAACGFVPPSVTLDGTHAATSQLTITTTGPTAGMRVAGAGTLGGNGPQLGRVAASFGLALVGMFAAILFRPRRAVRRVALLLAMLVIPVMALVACSGSPGGSGGGTPTGTYTIMVSGAAGTDTHAVPVTLTVN